MPENFDAETRTGVFIGSDIVERFLESKTIQSLRAVGEQLFENAVGAFFTRGRLQVFLVLHRANDGDDYVGLAFSVRTIRRSPLASTTSDAAGGGGGTFSDFTEASAQSGNSTGLVGAAVVTSAPPKPEPATGSPLADGFRMATIALSTVRYFFAARFTSATVTLFMASTISCGEVRPSPAIASDQLSASPGIEFCSNVLLATSDFFAASTSSAGTPLSA